MPAAELSCNGVAATLNASLHTNKALHSALQTTGKGSLQQVESLTNITDMPCITCMCGPCKRASQLCVLPELPRSQAGSCKGIHLVLCTQLYISKLKCVPHIDMHTSVQRHAVQTQAWMSKHRREVTRKAKQEKERQLEPLQRRTTARQQAAQQEIAQVCTHHQFCNHGHCHCHHHMK